VHAEPRWPADTNKVRSGGVRNKYSPFLYDIIKGCSDYTIEIVFINTYLLNTEFRE